MNTFHTKNYHCFDDFTSGIFVADMTECHKKNGQDEFEIFNTLKRFQEFCNSKWLQHLDKILFLNKFDLFKEKLEKFPLMLTFPEYRGSMYSEYKVFNLQVLKLKQWILFVNNSLLWKNQEDKFIVIIL